MDKFKHYQNRRAIESSSQFYYYGIFFDKSKLNTTDKIYYVYVLIDPTSNEPFYVGKGKEDRYKSHFSGNSHNSQVNERIKTINDAGLEVAVQFVRENIFEITAYMAEITETLRLRYKYKLCNIALPGPGNWSRKGFHHSDETKRKISISGKSRNRISEETHRRLSNYANNRPLSHLKKIQQGLLRRSFLSEQVIEKIKIYYTTRLDLSVGEIAELLNISPDYIREIGSGIRFSFIRPDLNPTQNQLKEFRRIRKSLTSKRNAVKYYENLKTQQ